MQGAGRLRTATICRLPKPSELFEYREGVEPRVPADHFWQSGDIFRQSVHTVAADIGRNGVEVTRVRQIV